MREEAACIIYYTKFTVNYKGTELHQYQKKLAMDLLRHGFSDFFLCNDFDETQIKRTETGKPYYALNPEWYFNISHCKDAVAVAVSKYPVGVDVESMRKVKPSVVRKCCSAKEFQYVIGDNEVADAEREELTYQEKQRFLQLWTLKESYVKMTGEGIRMPLNTIAFEPDTFHKEGNLLVCPKETGQESTSCLYFPEDLVVAVSICNGNEENCSRQFRFKAIK